MKAFFTYLYLYAKRQFKQFTFVFLLCLVPFCIGGFAHLQKTAPSQIRVALYIDRSNTVIETDTVEKSMLPDVSDTLEALVMQENMPSEMNLQFYLSDSVSSLKNDVATNKAECGYLIPDTLFVSMKNKNKNHLIQVITSPSTTLTPVLNEMLYAKLFQSFSLYLLKDYIISESPLSHTINQQELLQKTDALYQLHLSDDSTFAFTYATLNTNETASPVPYEAISLSPIRGILALFILLAGFCGAALYMKEKENHIYDNRPIAFTYRIQILSICIPMLLLSIMGLFSLFFAGLFTSFMKEFFALLLYLMLTTFILTIFTRLIRNRLYLLSSIPVLLFGSLVFTPVFVDITTFIPGLKPVSYLFLPYYYLMFFS